MDKNCTGCNESFVHSDGRCASGLSIYIESDEEKSLLPILILCCQKYM